MSAIVYDYAGIAACLKPMKAEPNLVEIDRGSLHLAVCLSDAGVPLTKAGSMDKRDKLSIARAGLELVLQWHPEMLLEVEADMKNFGILQSETVDKLITLISERSWSEAQ